MLKVMELKAFLDETQIEIPEVTRVELLSNEKRFAKIVKEIKSNDILLIGLLPSAKSKFNNEDKRVFKNNMAFLVVTRFDERKSEQNYLNSFVITQEVVLKLEKRLRRLKGDFQSKCTFFDFDFSKLSIIPVENYHQTNGWDLSITSETKK